MAQSERIQLCGQRAPPLDAAPRSSQRWRRHLLQLRPCAGPSLLPPNATVAKLGPQDRVDHASLLPFDKINGSAIYRCFLQELSISALLHMYGSCTPLAGAEHISTALYVWILPGRPGMRWVDP